MMWQEKHKEVTVWKGVVTGVWRFWRNGPRWRAEYTPSGETRPTLQGVGDSANAAQFNANRL